ncbi:hypothetical protein [Paraliomyxa miuraensis]|uniref:hypothetical protein n=1 Tax=Paraliomyxa miuraensis TaxID=376150 RepID=UPI0022584503|nr:hypothetical protein [Paraliomyxa miuraensis]MCX4240857.1 hypothetical protein [Paraliomyxa miuraensis]
MSGRLVVLASLIVVVTGSFAPVTARATPANCGELVLDDPLAGSTVGVQQGGTIDGSGFTPGDPPGSIVWNLPSPLREGCVEVVVSGVLTSGVGEHDLVELFTGPDGSFTDGNVDYFMLLKIAGDVFPGYEGRLKVELGLEYDALEVGSWAEPLPWAPADSHTLAVRLDGAGLVEFYRDDVLLEVVDYNEIAGGDLAFESLRIPNDGEYQVDPALGGAVYRDVRVYDADPGGGGDDTSGGPEPTTGGGLDTSGGPGPADDTAASEGDSGISTADDDGTAGTGVVTGVSTGLPPPGQQPSGAGCGCTAAPSSLSVASLLGLLAFRRRRRR